MLTALAVLGLGCAGLAAVTAAPASAATSCQVAYSTNDWSTGFTASITITNQGSALTSWSLTYSYSGNQQLTQGWLGNWSPSGQNVTVTNASWNGSLATGASDPDRRQLQLQRHQHRTHRLCHQRHRLQRRRRHLLTHPHPHQQPHFFADLIAHANRVAHLDRHRWRRVVQFRPGAAS